MMLIWLDQDEYEDKQKELEGIFNPIIQDLYAQAGGPPGGEMPGTNFYLFISIISLHIIITSTKAKKNLIIDGYQFFFSLFLLSVSISFLYLFFLSFSLFLISILISTKKNVFPYLFRSFFLTIKMLYLISFFCISIY